MPKNTIIYGPPGTGKTHTLLGLIDKHLQVRDRRTLFCSHTRAAAQEALSRWPVKNAANLDIQTLHGFCFKQLQISQAQTVDAHKLRDFGEEYGIEIEEDDSIGRQYLDVFNMAKAMCIPPEAAYEQSWKPGSPAHFKATVLSYMSWKDQYGFIDFNDMLTKALDRMHEVPRYSQVIVDEGQDLTPLQWLVMRRIRELLPQAEFILAGDDDQCLFAWSGASPHGMTQFGESMSAEKRILSQSYRVPKAVHKLAQRIILQVPDRVEKVYLPRDAPGSVTGFPDADSIDLRNCGDRDIMILHSDKFIRRELEPILKEQNVVYRTLNGSPAPLDTRAGKSLQIAARFSFNELEASDELLSSLKSGLNAYGQQVWDHVGPRTIYDRVRRRDMQVLSVYNAHIAYLSGVDLTRDAKVRVSTMHGAKGLEAADVMLCLSLSSAAWAHAANHPEHLHRLIYTAVTRSKNTLQIFDGPDAYELP